MTTVQATSRGLTAAQVKFFHREGYLVLACSATKMLLALNARVLKVTGAWR